MNLGAQTPTKTQTLKIPVTNCYIRYWKQRAEQVLNEVPLSKAKTCILKIAGFTDSLKQTWKQPP